MTGAPPAFALGGDEVHLWWIALDEIGPEVLSALTPDEISRAARFRQGDHRRRWLTARVALRHILAGYTGIAAEELEFRLGRWGKPELRVVTATPGEIVQCLGEGLTLCAPSPQPLSHCDGRGAHAGHSGQASSPVPPEKRLEIPSLVSTTEAPLPSRWLTGGGIGKGEAANLSRVSPNEPKAPLPSQWERSWGEGALRFNLAHSEGRAIVAVARGREVGIDLERLDPALDVASLLTVSCTAAEAARLTALPADRRVEPFLELWTVKEAFLKAIGTGFSREPRTIEIVAEDDGGVAVRDLEPGSIAASWHVRRLAPEPGWIAALVVAGAEPAITDFQWPPSTKRGLSRECADGTTSR